MKADDLIATMRYYYQVYLFDEDLDLYVKYMEELPDGAHVLDLGTGWGKSATALALVNPRVYVETIDYGHMQVEMGWAEDEEDYYEKVKELMKPFSVENVTMILGDCMEYSPLAGVMPEPAGYEYREDYKYDLIHMDMSKDSEQAVMKRYLSHLKPGGIFLVRNYFRFSKEADKMLKGYEYLENQGQIQVVRKP